MLLHIGDILAQHMSQQGFRKHLWRIEAKAECEEKRCLAPVLRMTRIKQVSCLPERYRGIPDIRQLHVSRSSLAARNRNSADFLITLALLSRTAYYTVFLMYHSLRGGSEERGY